MSDYGQNGLKTVKAYWDVVHTKTFRRRKVSVKIPYGKPKRVETSCHGIEKEDKVYVAASCYYPERKENQEVTWKGSQLVESTRNIQLEKPEFVARDWVVFDLTVQKAN